MKVGGRVVPVVPTLGGGVWGKSRREDATGKGWITYKTPRNVSRKNTIKGRTPNKGADEKSNDFSKSLANLGSPGG